MKSSKLLRGKVKCHDTDRKKLKKRELKKKSDSRK
jgi:hypothetical protein